MILSAQDFVLDVAHTAAPQWTNLDKSRPHSRLGGLARLGFPDGRRDALAENLETRPSPQHNKYTEPDDHLMCFDFVYYAVSEVPYEWERAWAPAWNFVGKHLHFTKTVTDLAEQYLRTMFDLTAHEPIPRVCLQF